MTPERYREVGEIFRAAAEIPLDRRGAFLDAACGHDEALRQDVESLLSHDSRSEIRSQATRPPGRGGQPVAGHALEPRTTRTTRILGDVTRSSARNRPALEIVQLDHAALPLIRPRPY